MKTKLLTLALLFVASFGMAQSTWVVDKAHSSIQFNVTHLVISKVTGKFDEFDAKLISTGNDFEGAEVLFNADVASINTDNDQRDNHLRSDDFFHAERYPKLTFNGKIVKEGQNYKLKGEMTIRDVTRSVTLDVDYNGTITDPWGNERAGFKASGTINRFDYNLNWNNLIETGGAIVGKDVEVVCNVALVKQG